MHRGRSAVPVLVMTPLTQWRGLDTSVHVLSLSQLHDTTQHVSVGIGVHRTFISHYIGSVTRFAQQYIITVLLDSRKWCDGPGQEQKW